MDYEMKARKEAYQVPSYSLTGDLVSFQRCGLQYRRGVLGRLPATRPVQMWFGEFIHGVMEEAWRTWRQQEPQGSAPVDFDDAQCTALCEAVETRLRLRGLRSRSRDATEVAMLRARAALRDLAPRLFPLISHAEVRLTGTRDLPPQGGAARRRNVEKYEMAGVVDVVTRMPAAGAPDPLQRRLAQLLGEGAMQAGVEVIVDYKGQSRPGLEYRNLYASQVQTYAYLRQAQASAARVVGGVLLFINELAPTWEQVKDLAAEIASGTADVAPEPGTPDWDTVTEWRKARRARPDEPPSLSLEFRMRRAVLGVAVDARTLDEHLKVFDGLVGKIEACREAESAGTRIGEAWPVNDRDEATCTACDFRVSCPGRHRLPSPRLPSA